MAGEAFEFDDEFDDGEFDDTPVRGGKQHMLAVRRKLEERLELRQLKNEYGFTDKELADLL